MKYVFWGLLFGVFQVIGGLLTPAKQRLCCYLFCLLRYNSAAHEWHDPPAGQGRAPNPAQWNALSSCLSRYIFVLLLRLSGLCILGRICLLRLLLCSFPVCLGPLFIQKRLKSIFCSGLPADTPISGRVLWAICPAK